MKFCSCGLSVKRTPSRAVWCAVANACQTESSSIGRPSPFDPGTSTTIARSALVPGGVHKRNSALSKFSPGGRVSSKTFVVWPTAGIASVTANNPPTHPRIHPPTLLIASLRKKLPCGLDGKRNDQYADSKGDGGQ